MRLRDALIRLLNDGHARPHAPVDPGVSEDHPLFPGLTPAAVLVAITDRPRPGVILTQRSSKLRKHAGQVAFPGGRVDPDDTDAIAAALREAREEIDLMPDAVEIIGVTDAYRTHSGFAIQPVIGIIPADLPLTAQPGEVDAIFEVPLDYLLDPDQRTAQYIEWEGEARHYHEIMWEERRIWGVTAAMIVNLSHRLDLLAIRAMDSEAE